MKQVGLTSTGSVIVEMSVTEYEALKQSQSPKPVASPAPKPDASKMSTADKVTFVKERILKLKPKKRDGVVHSIAAMFQFTGGIKDQEIQKVVTGLQNQKIMTISAEGKVSYRASRLE